MSTEVKIIQKETFRTITSAVNKFVDFIKPTYGPASNKVIIDKMAYRMVVDDGVQIARDYEITDNPEENAVVKLIRETAVKTNDRVGDGTTSSLIMLQAIINEVARRPKFDGRITEEELKEGLKDVQEYLKKNAKPIKTKEELKKVALISFDNHEVAEMIADLYFKLGKDATITIDKSSTMKTEVEMSNGVKIDRGYISPYMIVNPERMESVIEKPYILLTDYRMTEANDILKIMEKMAAKNKTELVVIAENVEQNALATAIVNKMQGKFLTVAIAAPSSGDDRKVFLEDIALMTGAKMFTESKGDKLENAEISDLGRADRFICRREESIIVGPKGSKAEIKKAADSLRAAIATTKNEANRKGLERRLGLYTNGLAVIKVGAPTENEQKSLKYKVEDAVNAVKSAFRGGVVCGAGLALARIKTCSPILNKALKYPHRQLMQNVGFEEDSANGLKEDEAINVVTGKSGKFMDVGVVDPAEVLLAGVESAVSIASILVTSSGIIVESNKEPNG